MAICKTVRPMLSDRCLSVLSCLPVTAVYCGQTVRWIKMTLGTEVGLGPRHIVFDGDRAPLPRKGTAAPSFRPTCMSIVAKRLVRSICHMVRTTEVGLGPGDSATPPLPCNCHNFRSMYIVAKRLDVSRCHVVRR